MNNFFSGISIGLHLEPKQLKNILELKFKHLNLRLLRQQTALLENTHFWPISRPLISQNGLQFGALYDKSAIFS